MKRKYDVKDDFFKEINSEEKAYLLGFFIADGTYSLGSGCKDSYRYQIHQQEIDKCIKNKQEYDTSFWDKNPDIDD